MILFRIIRLVSKYVIMSFSISILLLSGGCKRTSTIKENRFGIGDNRENKTADKIITSSLIPNDEISTIKLLDTIYSTSQDTLKAIVFNNTEEVIYKSSFFAFDYFDPETNVYQNVLPSNIVYPYIAEPIEPKDSIEVILFLSVIEDRKPGKYRLTLQILEPIGNYMVVDFELVGR